MADAPAAPALSLIALVFSPAAIPPDVVKIVEAIVLIQALGVLQPGQPGDPAMDHAAGHVSLGGR